MTKLKPWLVILAVCIGSLILAAPARGACAAAPASPRDVVIAAHQKLQALPAYHLSIGATMAFTLQGKTITVVTKSETDFQATPLLARSVIVSSSDAAAGKKEEKTIAYMQKTGNEITVYTQAGGQWQKQTLPYYDPLTEYANYFTSIKAVTLLKETGSFRQYEVVIDAAAMKESLDKALSAALANKLTLPADLLKTVGDFKYTLTIDNKTAAITGMDYDLSALVAAISGSMVDALDLPAAMKDPLKEMFKTMKMTSSARFAPATAGKIVIPPEALNAPAKQLGTPAAAKGSAFVDVKRLMAESPFVKVRQQLIEQKGKELADRLNSEKAGLTEDQFRQKQSQYYQEFAKRQQDYEKEILDSLQQAVAQILKERNLAALYYKNEESDAIPAGSLDITDDVMAKMH